MKYPVIFLKDLVKKALTAKDLDTIQDCFNETKEQYSMEEIDSIEKKISFYRQVFEQMKTEFPKPYYEPCYMLTKIRYAKDGLMLIAIGRYLTVNSEKYTANAIVTLKQCLTFRKAELTHKAEEHDNS